MGRSPSSVRRAPVVLAVALIFGAASFGAVRSAFLQQPPELVVDNLHPKLFQRIERFLVPGKNANGKSVMVGKWTTHVEFPLRYPGLQSMWRLTQGGFRGNQFKASAYVPSSVASRYARALWHFRSIDPGPYDVYMTWKGGQQMATAAPVRIREVQRNLTEAPLLVNQRGEPSGEVFEGRPWQKLGTFMVTKPNLVVDISNANFQGQPPVGGTVGADAVRLVRLPRVDLSLTSTVELTVHDGNQELTMRQTVHNAGPDAPRDIVLQTLIPENLLPTNLPPGCEISEQSVICSNPPLDTEITYAFVIPAGMACPADFTIFSQVDNAEFDTNSSNNTVVSETRVLCASKADLRVSAQTPVEEVSAGGEIPYTLTITNAGPDDATNVLLDTSAPAFYGRVKRVHDSRCEVTRQYDWNGDNEVWGEENILCRIGDLPTGESTDISFDISVKPEGVPCDYPLALPSLVSGSEVDENEDDNFFFVETRVVCNAAADLRITLESSTPDVSPGDVVSYSASITNTGPGVAERVFMHVFPPMPDASFMPFSDGSCRIDHTNDSTDPAGNTDHSIDQVLCDFGSIPSGQGRGATFTVLLNDDASCVDGLEQVVATSSTTEDPNPENNIAAFTHALHCAPAGTDIGVTLSGPSAVLPGNIASFELTGVNNGPDAVSSPIAFILEAPGISFFTPHSDDRCSQEGSSIRCVSNQLRPVERDVFGVVFYIPIDIACGATYTIRARVSETPQGDPLTENNAAETQFTVPCATSSSALDVIIDGPAQQNYTRQQDDAVLANIVLSPSRDIIDLRRLYFAIQAKTNDNRGLQATNRTETDNIHEILEDVELRNVRTGQTIDAQRLTWSGDLGTSTAQTYQIYLVRDITVDRPDTWEVRADFIDNTAANSPRSGDSVRVHICGEPTHVDGEPNPTPCTFGGLISMSNAYALQANDHTLGTPIRTATPRGTISGNFHKIAGATLAISVKTIGTTDTVVTGQKNVNLLRFEARASEAEDIFFHRIDPAADGQTSLDNAQNFSLWVDTDGNGVVDTVLQDHLSPVLGNMSFSDFSGGGYVVPRGSTVLFEIHADIAQSPATPNTLQLKIFPLGIGAERSGDGVSLEGISIDNQCTSTSCEIFLTTTPSQRYTIIRGGDLFVTHSATPVRSRQLLGGTLGDPILHLQFHAENEDVDVTDLQLTGEGQNSGNTADILRSVDRFELYKAGETTAFASATRGGCGSDIVPANTFCANMENRQLIVPRGQDVTVLVRPRIKTDVEGGMRYDRFSVKISGAAVANNTTGEGAVRARGVTSSNSLAANNGNNTAEGEIFIGTNTPASNREIIGVSHMTVMSKISSITNANPDANGTNVPTGIAPIGQFKFSAAPNSNSLNGLNKAVISDVIFNITATNVQLDSAQYFFYNKANVSAKHHCDVMSEDNQIATGTVQGAHMVRCSGIHTSQVNVAIDQGTNSTFVLEARVLNAQVSSVSTSTLQVSLQQFSDMSLTGTFGPHSSHIEWHDQDSDGIAFQWIEYPETVVKSTSYQS
ncbi:MAG: hypothetical protein Q7R81_06060 [Candidatus Peregrinibacteria bacterium]|nr:hypothetical protein [Candidatus Peregrinibacteria bacterium]